MKSQFVKYSIALKSYLQMKQYHKYSPIHLRLNPHTNNWRSEGFFLGEIDDKQ